ncbi:MAG TPA: hypothetical protein VIC35_12525 [Acidimicrobiia bacterium]|jgi:hypothetical protein
MTLTEKLHALHRSLGSVPHAFGGAIALAYYTEEPRATRDLDVNVFVDASEARRVLELLPPGVHWNKRDVAAIERGGQVRLWWDDVPVDLFFSNVPFHEVTRHHVRTVEFDGEAIPILGGEELAVYKAAFSRPKDWVDIKQMLDAQTIDPVRVSATLTRLLGPAHASTTRFLELAAAEPETASEMDPGALTFRDVIGEAHRDRRPQR